jgi:poly(3-hydroxybutyrate) depolymerase
MTFPPLDHSAEGGLDIIARSCPPGCPRSDQLISRCPQNRARLAGAAALGWGYQSVPAQPLLSASASEPAAENCDCKSPSHPIPLLLMTGTADPLNPYFGGEVSFHGFFSRGTVLSSSDTADRFVRLNGLNAAPTVSHLAHRQASGNTSVRLTSWREPGKDPVLQYTVVNGGHVIPNPRFRARRFLGQTTLDVDAPTAIWDFFESLPSRSDERARA